MPTDRITCGASDLETTSDRTKITQKLVDGRIDNGVAVENIFVDPLVQPLSVHKEVGVPFIDAIVKPLRRGSSE